MNIESIKLRTINQEKYLKLIDYIQKTPMKVAGGDKGYQNLYKIKGNLEQDSRNKFFYHNITIEINPSVDVPKEITPEEIKESIKGLINMLVED